MVTSLAVEMKRPFVEALSARRNDWQVPAKRRACCMCDGLQFGTIPWSGTIVCLNNLIPIAGEQIAITQLNSGLSVGITKGEQHEYQ
jgi:hypothetical protein